MPKNQENIFFFESYIGPNFIKYTEKIPLGAL